MNSSDLEVIPYIGNEYMHLSLSTKAFECASVGLPIICTDLRTMRSAFDENAVKYAKDRNPIDFAEKIIELCCNPDLRRKMTMNAYRSIIEISGDVMEEKYLRLIEHFTGYSSFSRSPEGIPKLLQPESQNSEHINE